MTTPDASHATYLEPSDNRLFRQVRNDERYIRDGVVTSYAFRPMPKDQGELSVDVEPLTTAAKCYADFIANGGHSVGVWAVTTQECAKTGLAAYHKPRTAPPPNPSHGIVDFTSLTDKESRKKGAKLAEFATIRKRVYPEGEVQAQPPPASPATGDRHPPRADPLRYSDESST